MLQSVPRAFRVARQPRFVKQGFGLLRARSCFPLPVSRGQRYFAGSARDATEAQENEESGAWYMGPGDVTYSSDSDDELAQRLLDAEGLLRATGGEGDARVKRAIEEGVDSLEEILDAFPFELDRFQQQAVRALLEQSSVVVCAPTGAGKTAIAEAAAIACLAKGKRAIYTTPLKALSNQKLVEMRERFGAARLGLQTGDVSLNSEADITIMTTEILRNIMYRASMERSKGTEAQQQASAAGLPEAVVTQLRNTGPVGRLEDVGLIVLDEVHYLSDPYRGTVWEEVIINCPKHVSILAMSATVKNPQDLGNWITEVHGPCRTIQTKKRPVPLLWQYSRKEGRMTKMMPLLAPSGKQLSRELRPKAERIREIVQEAGRDWGEWKGVKTGSRRKGLSEANGREKRDGDSWSIFSDGDDDWVSETEEGDDSWAGMRGVPSMESVVEELRMRQMLPAIWFVFSRRGCDLAAEKVASQLNSLVTASERAEIAREVEKMREEQPESLRSEMERALLKGIAPHHAGCLPGWKSLVERLFQRGLLKLVFATDTLAAGINMPARTTVIDRLSRRRGSARFERLRHNELLQMAGRAGRRGFDSVGHCVIVQGPLEGSKEAFDTINAGPEPLVSQFNAGYSMVLNVLATRSLPEARSFLTRTFGAFLSGKGREVKQAEAEALEEEAEEALQRVRTKYKLDLGIGGAASDETRRLERRLREEENTLAFLQRQVAEARGEEVLSLLSEAEGAPFRLPRPVALSLPGPKAPKAALALAWVPVDAVPCVAMRQKGSQSSGDQSDSPVSPSEASTSRAASRSRTAKDAAAEALAAIPWGEEGADNDDESEETRAGRGQDRGDDESPDEDDDGSPWDDQEEDEEGEEADSFVAWEERLVCVMRDGRLVAVTPDAVVGALEGALVESGRLPLAVTAYALGLAPGDWEPYVPSGAGWRAGGESMSRASVATAPASAESQELGSRIPPIKAMAMLVANDDMEASVRFQEAIVGGIRRQLQAGPSGDGRGQDKALPRKAAKKMARAKRLLRKADRIRRELAELEGREWRTFEDSLRILVTLGAVVADKDDPSRLTATPLGEVAREVRCENELWMALALREASGMSLTPAELAGLVGALVGWDVVGSRPGVSCAYEPSPAVAAAMEALEGPRGDLEAVQIASGHMGASAAVVIDARLCGLVEAWVAGASWEQVARDSTLDDGDIARLLSRVVDVLRQAMHCKHLDAGLRDVARDAVRQMVRQPISELL